MGHELVFVGAVIFAAVAAKGVLERLTITPLVAYLALGVCVRLADDRTDLLDAGGMRALEGLGAVGITVLLFRVGLKSNVRALIKQLRKASSIWAGDVTISGALGFAAAAWLLGQDMLGSAVVAIAMTATSVGVSAEVWNRTDKLDTPAGELFIDVAELDDISGVVAVAGLFALTADQPGGFGASPGTWPVAATVALVLVILAKLAGFMSALYAFAHWAEPRVTRVFDKLGKPPHPMLLIAATGLIMAGTAEILGLSVAIGAFFAGLAYSRDPHAVRYEKDFEVLYDLFMPFFFIHVGLQVTPDAFAGGLGPGLVLLCAGVIGKLAGNFLPGVLVTDRATAALLALSMIPRAEIALFVAQQAATRHYLSRELLSGFIILSATTSVIAPWILELRLRTSPIAAEEPSP